MEARKGVDGDLMRKGGGFEVEWRAGEMTAVVSSPIADGGADT